MSAPYNGDIQACDVCAVGKCEQQPHPKKATYDLQRAFPLVSVDITGAISPQALGGYDFVTKFVDQHTKGKGHLSHQRKNANCRFSGAIQQGSCDSYRCSLESSQGGQRYGVYEFCVQTVLS